MKITSCKVSELKTGGFNVRQSYSVDGLKELVASVLQYGIRVPLLVRECGKGYEVLDGGRRLQAALALGISEVPVVVVSSTESEAGALAWVLNFQREAVPFVEECRWMGRLVNEQGVAAEELGVLLGRSAGFLRSRLAVLGWPANLVSYCELSNISFSVAREYARLGESVELERALDWDKINGPSYRQAASYVEGILLARETVVTPEEVAAAVVIPAYVCDACGGERDYRTSRNLAVCASCLKGLGL